jgi:hypothetical protein
MEGMGGLELTYMSTKQHLKWVTAEELQASVGVEGREGVEDINKKQWWW